MYRNFNICPEIEELKKAILLDLPDDVLNSNSNSKDKFSLIQKKEKDVALDFLRKFNEAQEKSTLERKEKAKEKEKEQENFRVLFEKDEKKRIEEENYKEKQANIEEKFMKPKEKFNRLATLNEFEEFNNEIIGSNANKFEKILQKKRRISHEIDKKLLRKIKEETSSQIIPKEFNKLRIEFKTDKNPIIQKEEEITIQRKPLKFYSNEEKLCENAENLRFLGKVIECYKNNELWFMNIEKIDVTKKEKMSFKAIYNGNLNSVYESSSLHKIKEIKPGLEYIFEFKSAPKVFNGKGLIFLEGVFPSRK